MADFVTPNPCTATFVHLFKPNDQGKYELTLLFDKNDAGQMEDVKAIAEQIAETIKAGCTEEIGYNPKTGKSFIPFAGCDPNNEAWVRTLQTPLKDADAYVLSRGKNAGRTRAQVTPEFAGKFYMVVKTSKNLSTEKGSDGMSLLRDLSTGADLDRRSLYPGALVRPVLWFRPYVTEQNDMGIQAVLQALVKTGDGTPLIDMEDRDPLAAFNLPRPGGADAGADAGRSMLGAIMNGSV